MRSRRAVVIVAPLIALPFLVRLIYFLETRDQPYFQWNFLVAYVNHTFASDLAQGIGGPYTLYRSPWYPLAVSWLYRLAGAEPMHVRLAQWLMGGLGCLLTWRLGLILFDRRVAMAALVTSALFVPAICQEGELFEQPAATFLLLASLTLLASSRSDRHDGPGSAQAAEAKPLAAISIGAAAFGGAVLLRPDLVLGLPLLLAFLAAGPDALAGRVRRVGVFVAVCGVMALPLCNPGILINVQENHADINAAINLHLGNNPQATGHDALFPETPELPTIDPAARRDHMTGLDLAGIRYAMARTGAGLESVAPFWRGETLRFVTEQPAAELKLLGVKTVLFFNGYLTGTQKDIYFQRESSWTLWTLLWCAGLCFPMGLILPLAVVGSVARMARPSRLLLLSVPAGCFLTTLAFFYDARFLMPAAPFMILLACHGLFSLVDSMRERPAGRLAKWAGPATLTALIVFCNADWLSTHKVNRAAEEFRVGTMHLDQDEPAAAVAAYRLAVSADPSFVPALDNLAAAAMSAGEAPATIDFMQRLAETDRATPALLRTLATLRIDLAGSLMAGGDCVRALELAGQVLAHDGDSRARAIAGHCLQVLGRPDEAVAMLEEGTRMKPDDITMLGLLGQVFGSLGRRPDEQRCYLRVLEIDPRHALAAYQLALSLEASGHHAEALARARQAQSLGHSQAGILVRDLESRQSQE